MNIFKGIKEIKFKKGEEKPITQAHILTFLREIDEHGNQLNSEIWFNNNLYTKNNLSNEWFGTEEEYNAIESIDNNTLYYIYE